jgi:hypothetical protein
MDMPDTHAEHVKNVAKKPYEMPLLEERKELLQITEGPLVNVSETLINRT